MYIYVEIHIFLPNVAKTQKRRAKFENVFEKKSYSQEKLGANYFCSSTILYHYKYKYLSLWLSFVLRKITNEEVKLKFRVVNCKSQIVTFKL